MRRLSPREQLFLFLFLLSFFCLLLWPPRSTHTDLGSDPLDGAVFKRRIVAVGDLHSYLPNAHKVLQMAGVVDDRIEWTGNVDYLVQTGDLVDRGADTIKVYQLFDDLRAQAAAQGGLVVSHYGNHEWMNLLSDWRFVTPDDIDSFGGSKERQEIWSSKGWLGQTLVGNYSITSRVPLHPTAGSSPLEDFKPESTHLHPLWNAALSFVHGGLHPELPFLTPYPSKINSLGNSLVKRIHRRQPIPPPHPPAEYPGLPQDTPGDEYEIYGANGPLWFRGWAQAEETDQFCATAQNVIDTIGVRRLIMGHTPNFERIVSKCDGKIIIIDTGITPAYGGVLSALRIDYGLVPQHPISPLRVNGEVEGYLDKSVWKEVEVVTAIYESHTVELARLEQTIEGKYQLS